MQRSDAAFVLEQMVVKDFKIRYRNMSLGVLWSLLTPLVMMAVLTFVFTRVLPSDAAPQYPLFVLCGLIPFSFFSVAWLSGTGSLVDNGSLIKRVRMRRELVPISTVLANSLHLLIQLGLLLALVLVAGSGFNRHWVWLPVMWLCEVLFVIGLSMITAALYVYVRDMRYAVESATMVLFWLVPIFYPFSAIPQQYHSFFQYNPVAALVLAMRNVLLEGQAPSSTLLWKLALVSVFTLGCGWLVFRRLQRRFFDYL